MKSKIKRIFYLGTAIVFYYLNINVLPKSKPKPLSKKEIDKRIFKVVESIKLDLEHGRE
ncbi:MAG TPA: hypothetical protein VMX17_07840 [Candidatus Glassbacteria bacterium]|nr:hypothetical protein [Candidatus Glassbacteria bacterium]